MPIFLAKSHFSKIVNGLTTKTCSHCGRTKYMGDKKIYQCKCGMIADRDVNAAKNILKVGYNNKNQDKDMVLQTVDTIDVVYDEQNDDYEVNVHEI